MVKMLKIKVVPNSKRDEIVNGNEMVVKVKAPPVNNKANKAVERLLSKFYKCNVEIISGRKSKIKFVKIHGENI